MCDFCSDFTTWQMIAGPQAAPDHDTPPNGDNPDHPARSATQELNIQLRLIPDEDEHVD